MIADKKLKNLKSCCKNWAAQAKQGFYFAFDFELSYLSWLFHTLGGKKLPQYLISEINSEAALHVGAKEYSQNWLEEHKPQRRTRFPLQFLAAIPGQTNGKLLIVGPRYESEIFLARGLGWRNESIIAIDLLSYSKRVVQGDIHETAFENEEFDSIALPWIISYSFTPKKLTLEISRILKPGGVAVFAVDCLEPGEEESLSVPRGDQRLQSREQFMNLLPNFDVIFESYKQNNSKSLILGMQKKP